MSDESEKSVVLSLGEFSIRLVGFADPTALIPQVMTSLQNVRATDHSFGETSGVQEPAVENSLREEFSNASQELGRSNDEYTLRPIILETSNDLPLPDVAPEAAGVAPPELPRMGGSDAGSYSERDFDRIANRAPRPVSKLDTTPDFVGRRNETQGEPSDHQRKLRIIREDFSNELSEIKTDPSVDTPAQSSTPKDEIPHSAPDIDQRPIDDQKPSEPEPDQPKDKRVAFRKLTADTDTSAPDEGNRPKFRRIKPEPSGNYRKLKA